MTGLNERNQRDASHYARMETHAQTMELHNQRFLEFAAYQDMCFRMQKTHLNPGFDVFPNAPGWLSQYPPMPPRDMGAEGIGDNDDVTRTVTFNADDDGDGGQGGDDGDAGDDGNDTEVLHFDDD